MSTGIKRLFLCLIGILAGLAAWPFAELLLVMQGKFPSYLIFSIILGAIFGLVIGLFFCSTEGITQSNGSKIAVGMIVGAVVGLIGGIIGFLVGQLVLFIVGDKLMHSIKRFNLIGLPISRAIGWGILGMFIGITEGLRSVSFEKMRIGVLGGLIGGILGGLILEYSRVIIPNIMIARLLGLLMFGLCIGLFYGFVEKKLSFGILRLLNGKYKGKEYFVNQKKVKIGKAKSNDICLTDYSRVSDKHAMIYVKKDNIYIKGLKSQVKVNDDPVNEHKLLIEDVIKIGEAKFLYKY